MVHFIFKNLSPHTNIRLGSTSVLLICVIYGEKFYKIGQWKRKFILWKPWKGATTFSITTLSIMTLSITTISITTLSITTISITTLSIMTLSMAINNTQHLCRVPQLWPLCWMSLCWMSWRHEKKTSVACVQTFGRKGLKFRQSKNAFCLCLHSST